MTETITTSTGTAYYSRKVQPKQYESEECSIFVQFDMAASGGETLANAAEAFAQAKSTVLEQLGLAFTLDASGRIVETGTAQVAAATVAAPSPEAQVAAVFQGAAPATSDKPPFDGATTDKAQKQANKAWATARWSTNPDEFFDNRPKKAAGEFKQTSPDVKHKDSGIGVWFS